MSHYKSRVEQDLDDIRDRVSAIAVRVVDAHKMAMRALLTQNRDLAYKVVLNDLPINRQIRGIDKRCHAFVARHLPSARHLRTVSSILRLTLEIERVGDYAVTIAREATQIEGRIPTTTRRHIELMAEQARSVLSQALRSWNEQNGELARGTKVMAPMVDESFHRAYQDLLEVGQADDRPSLPDLLSLFVVFNMLERVSDQAKNICEETLFATSGETKPPKRYRILFLSSSDDGLGPLAAAIARKRYPQSGTYVSAGIEPAAQLVPVVEAFLAERLDAAGHTPQPLDRAYAALDGFHVVVGLDGHPSDLIPTLPFHTSALSWDVDALPARGVTTAHLEEARHALSREIRDLLELMRGSGTHVVTAPTQDPQAASAPSGAAHGDDARDLAWYSDKLAQVLIFIGGISAIVFILGIFIFVTKEGIGFAAGALDLREFLTSPAWRPTSEANPTYGALALIAGTASVTGLAMMVAVPLSLGAAIYISEFATGRAREVLKVLIEMLAAIPSVVWGFVGLSIMNGLIVRLFDVPVGLNVLNAGLILGLMAAPIMTTIAEDALKAVPDRYREAAEAMGATRWQVAVRVVLPAAKNGLVAAVLLGVGRGFGETVAVLMASGHAIHLPTSPLDSVRALTATIATELGDAAVGSDHYQALFFLGISLFLVTFLINLVADLVVRGVGRRHASGVPPLECEHANAVPCSVRGRAALDARSPASSAREWYRR